MSEKGSFFRQIVRAFGCKERVYQSAENHAYEEDILRADIGIYSEHSRGPWSELTE